MSQIVNSDLQLSNQQLEADPILQYIIEQCHDLLGFDLDRVSRDYGIRQEDFAALDHYKAAFSGWVDHVWARLPAEQARKYGLYSGSFSYTESLRCNMRTIRRLSMIVQHYQDDVCINLDLVARDYGIKQENYENQNEYKEAIDEWWVRVWSVLPNDKARKYSVVLPNTSSRTYPTVTEGSGKVTKDLFNCVRGEFKITREQFKTEEEYNKAVISWWYNIWAVVLEKAACQSDMHSPANSSHQNSSFNSIKRRRTIHGIHWERFCRDCGFKELQFNSDREYSNAIICWWKNVWEQMPPEEAQKYVLFTPGASYEANFFPEIGLGSGPKIREEYSKVLAIRVDCVRRDLAQAFGKLSDTRLRWFLFQCLSRSKISLADGIGRLRLQLSNEQARRQNKSAKAQSQPSQTPNERTSIQPFPVPNSATIIQMLIGATPKHAIELSNHKA